MATPGSGSNLEIDGPAGIWWDPTQPTDIHLTIDDADLVHPTTGKKGIHLSMSSNPRSADFNPRYFNTFRSLLERHGKPHPSEPADERISRRLDSRS